MFWQTYKKGIVFFTTLILLGVTILICTGMTIMLARNSYTSRRIKSSMQAYFLAEAGVEEALEALHGNFNFTPTGYPKSLGEGTYDVTMTTHATNTDLKIITATGTVNNVSRTIITQVRFVGVTAFDYPVLGGGGKMRIEGGSVIQNVPGNPNPIRIHSNCNAMAPATSPALLIGGPNGAGTVVGHASACGLIYVDPVVGSAISTEPLAAYVPLPPFDAEFFQYYYDKAAEDGNVLIGQQNFISDPCAGTTNGICYVVGPVRLEGTWTMTGCIVATGKIDINKGGGQVTQNQWGDLPAFMSIDNNVEIWDTTTINGMCYGGNRIYVHGTSSGNTTVWGALYAKERVHLLAQTTVYYVKPDIPGLPEGSSTVEVVSWSGG